MENNKAADIALTGALNSFGLEGTFKATQMPIKNRINAIDVSFKSRSYFICLIIYFI